MFLKPVIRWNICPAVRGGTGPEEPNDLPTRPRNALVTSSFVVFFASARVFRLVLLGI